MREDAERFEHERAWDELNVLARVIAEMVRRHEPVSEAVIDEYAAAREWWESCLGRPTSKQADPPRLGHVGRE